MMNMILFIFRHLFFEFLLEGSLSNQLHAYLLLFILPFIEEFFIFGNNRIVLFHYFKFKSQA
jgi:hypothetical protein